MRCFNNRYLNKSDKRFPNPALTPLLLDMTNDMG